jgi:DNA-binding NarL/FixJ family response regulator
METKVLLTRRQNDVLQLLKRGYCNKEIAQELCITLSVVEEHVGALCSKFGVRDRLQVVIYAFEHGY